MTRRSIVLLASIALVTPLGLYLKRYYHGPAEGWVHDSVGGVLYVILWCLVAALCNSKWRPAPVATGVLTVTCILEFLQLSHHPLLEWGRSYFLGRTLLGSYFDWYDFPYYFAGAAIGWVGLRALPRA